MIITQEYKSVNVRYRGHKITVKRWADLASGETLHWEAVVAKTVQQFEKQFILQVDAMELEPTLATAEETAAEATDTP